MCYLLLLVCTAAAFSIATTGAWAVKPTRDEMDSAARWTTEWFGPDANAYPFSFTYDGRPSSQLLPRWNRARSSRRLDRNRIQHTLTWTDPASGLVVRCVALQYREFPTVEWTVYFRNNGQADTPIIQDIQALDAVVRRAENPEFILHHNTGSLATRSDYAPQETPLAPGAAKRIAADKGRPTQSDMSYFNLAWGHQGMIVVVGWPGQWAAEFARDQSDGIRIRAGQELTHLRLHPGEEIRTPLIVLQAWVGDWIRGQNLWRRWMLAHGVPRPGGRPPKPLMLASSSRAYQEMIGANEANQIMHIDRYLQERLKIDYWWMDAGWYVQQKGWPQVGTWEVDRARFPNGFKKISQHAHSRGVKILVWFEPERVAAGTWLMDNHPDWILRGGDNGLLNLGNPEAWNWLVEHIDRLITENGIDLYRQDFNIDPLPFWRANDPSDRQGITELKYVMGYLAFWDELRRRHPNMLIDSCASGGRRNDLETMRRAVPLWRSDYAYEPIGHQCMTYGISMWLPYHGTGTVASAAAPYYGGGVTAVEPYAFWSNAAPALGCGVDVRERGLDYPALRRLFSQWRQVSRCYYGDYYPLTPYTQADDAWIAWQFNRPERGDGMVQAFRRQKCVNGQLRLRLYGLDPNASYVVAAVGERDSRRLTGREMMQEGLDVVVPEQPGAAVMTYRRVKEVTRAD